MVDPSGGATMLARNDVGISSKLSEGGFQTPSRFTFANILSSSTKLRTASPLIFRFEV
jgi:hypothetical protein